MTETTRPQGKLKRYWTLFLEAIKGSEHDFTGGSIRRAVILLAIPMILELSLESVFAVVDIFFVGRLGNAAVATVGFTESVLSIVYSLAMGLSMAATALVARRVGEKNYKEAAQVGMQVIVFAIALSIVLSVIGVIFAGTILHLMGATDAVVAQNVRYAQIMYGGNLVIMLLFLINGIFRGAGDASIAMRSLWVSNICNIILCPLLINGLGPIPRLGLEGAAIATTTGRGIGVLYQLYRLFIKRGLLTFYLEQLKPQKELLLQILNIGSTAAVQFLIASGSWIFLNRLVANYHEAASAGYQIAIRLLIFFLLPAWGMSNAAATLTGQNLGAGKPERAEQSVWITAGYITIFMLCVSLFLLIFSAPIVNFINSDVHARYFATQALRTISLSYIFFGIAMVMLNAFNGAGDTRTPTIVNLVGFWIFQIPLAWVLSQYVIKQPMGIFIAIIIAQCVTAGLSFYLFKRGKWKLVKV